MQYINGDLKGGNGRNRILIISSLLKDGAMQTL
jgi:hypothetical protein